MGKEERMTILKMVEEGKVSSAEGLELLEALGQDGGGDRQNSGFSARVPESEMKMLRIRVKEGDGKTKVNVNLPLPLIKVGLDIAKSIKVGEHQELLKQIDMDEILRLINQGAQGKILEVEAPEDQTYVEIFVD